MLQGTSAKLPNIALVLRAIAKQNFTINNAYPALLLSVVLSVADWLTLNG